MDASFAPSTFRGLPSEDAEVWLSSFEKYANFRNMSDEHKLAFLPVVLKDAASEWFDMLAEETRSSWEQFRTKFKERFQDSDVNRYLIPTHSCCHATSSAIVVVANGKFESAARFIHRRL